jgi:uncharacterized protein Yka (UPF0111/DUF47 family)
LSFIYTDIHRSRLDFFKSLFDQAGVVWSSRGSARGDFETAVGQRTCATTAELRDLLTLIGSKLVFLIDWNRARKRLSRFMKKADAVAALRWAADHDHGHRGFLETGGERLIYNALERTAPSQLRYGARLDEVMGREATLAFVEAVLRITSEAMQQGRSLRLVRDEVHAELLAQLHDSQHGALALAADHAALVAALAQTLNETLYQLKAGANRSGLSAVVGRAKRWESKADDIVIRARQAQRHLPDSEAVRRLLPVADDVADKLEETVFLLTLLGDHVSGGAALDTLVRLAKLALLSAQEYVKCVEVARDIRRGGTRDDVQQFLLAVDRVITLEHESDEAERRAESDMLETAEGFRALHLLSQVAHGLEESVDALARCALMLKDVVMSDLLVD